MSHRSRGPIRLFAASCLFAASLAVGVGGAFAATADPDGQSGAATTVSPTPLPAEKPTCAPSETAPVTPAPHGTSTPAGSAPAEPQLAEVPSDSATPTATAAEAAKGTPLARTGSSVGPIVGALAVALAVGGVLVVVARRRATR